MEMRRTRILDNCVIYSNSVSGRRISDEWIHQITTSSNVVFYIRKYELISTSSLLSPDLQRNRPAADPGAGPEIPPAAEGEEDLLLLEPQGQGHLHRSLFSTYKYFLPWLVSVIEISGRNFVIL
jgi:hypothetical protein